MAGLSSSSPPPSVEVEAVRADAEAVRAEAEVLRATNTRLRRVIESLGERHAAELAAEREARRLVEVRVAELERRVGMDSGNSSVPPSREPIGAKARRKAARAVSQRQRSKDRKPGGQPGHGGAGLRPAEVPDRTEQADPPVECAACHEDLSTVPCPGEGWAQVWDTPPIRVETVHYRLPRLPDDGHGERAAPPGRVGGVRAEPERGRLEALLGAGVHRPRPRPSRRPAGDGRVRPGDAERVAGRAGAVRG